MAPRRCRGRGLAAAGSLLLCALLRAAADTSTGRGWLKPYGYLLPCDSQMSALQLWPRWGLGEGGSRLLELPVGVQIPLLPGTKPVFCRTKLGEKLHQPSAQFHLEDPYGRLLHTEYNWYNCLHDPHLQAYYNRKDNLQRLKSKGFITSSGKVVCSLKEFNEYRQYLTTLKLEAEKIRRQEEEKLQQQLAKLKKLDARLMAGSDRSRQSSSSNVYLVTKEKASLLQPQKAAGPTSDKSRRNFLHSGQYRRLKVTPSSLELGREDAKLAGSIHPLSESERKSSVPADSVFEAASEEQAARERQKIEDMARAVVRQVGKLEEMTPREALEGAFSQASPDKVTKGDVGSVCHTLESFAASRVELQIF